MHSTPQGLAQFMRDMGLYDYRAAETDCTRAAASAPGSPPHNVVLPDWDPYNHSHNEQVYTPGQQPTALLGN